MPTLNLHFTAVQDIVLAMPIYSETLVKKSSSPPRFTFIGPDSSSQVRALNASGIQVASFMVDGHLGFFTISRHGNSISSNTTPVCTCHTSSLSGTRNIIIHGHSATLKLQTYFEMSTTNRPLKWRIEYGLDSAWSWNDDDKNLVATGTKKDKKLEVFVAGDELVFHCLMATWMTKLLDLSPSTKALATGFKILPHVVNAGSICSIIRLM
jgi:hypothetical protein